MSEQEPHPSRPDLTKPIRRPEGGLVDPGVRQGGGPDHAGTHIRRTDEGATSTSTSTSGEGVTGGEAHPAETAPVPVPAVAARPVRNEVHVSALVFGLVLVAIAARALVQQLLGLHVPALVLLLVVVVLTGLTLVATGLTRDRRQRRA